MGRRYYYDSNFYTNTAVTDPQNTVINSYHVIQGGTYYNHMMGLCSSRRDKEAPNYTRNGTGFRCAKSQ